jgi:hypothetical protein
MKYIQEMLISGIFLKSSHICLKIAPCFCVQLGVSCFCYYACREMGDVGMLFAADENAE